MYGTLLKYTVIFVVTHYWPKFDRIPANQNDLGLTNWFRFKTVCKIVSLIHSYENIVLILQIIIVLLYVIKGIVVIQHTYLDIYDTYGIPILIVLVKWIKHTILNYVSIKLTQAKEMQKVYKRMQQRYIVLIDEAKRLRVRTNRPRPTMQVGNRAIPGREFEFIQEFITWQQERRESRQELIELVDTINELGQELQQKGNELNERYEELEELRVIL